MVPHGISVALTAPPAFRFTADTAPERHLKAAKALGADTSKAGPGEAGHLLETAFIAFMKRLDLPNGLSAIGYTSEDIPALVAGALEQQRLLKLSPKNVEAQDLEKMFHEAMTYW
jgi:alcohol dehydrogenase class IV